MGIDLRLEQLMKRIIPISKGLEKVFWGLTFLLPLGSALLWGFGHLMPTEMMASGLPFYPVTSSSLNIGISDGMQVTDLPGVQLIHLDASTRLLAFLVSLLPISVMMYLFKNLQKLFGYYAKGNYFTEQNIVIFKRLGYSIFAWMIMNLIHDCLLSVVLTYLNPPGSRLISVSLSSTDIFYGLIAVMVIVISHVMHEGLKLSNEQAHTI